MKKYLLMLVAFFLLSGCAFAPTSSEKIVAEVISVTDGDTIRVILDGEEVKVRILSIDTPEKFGDRAKDGPQPFAEEAAARAEELLLGKEIILELSRNDNPYDKYDRLLANIWIDEDILYQEIMLEEGLARLAYVYEPDTQYTESILAPAEEYARKNRLGVWSIEGYVTEKGFR